MDMRFARDKYYEINSLLLEQVEKHDPKKNWLPSLVEMGNDLFLKEEYLDPRLPYFRTMLLHGGPLEWPDAQSLGLSWFSNNPQGHVAAASNGLAEQKELYLKTLRNLGAEWYESEEDLIGTPYAYPLSGKPQTNFNLRNSFYYSLFRKFAYTESTKHVMDLGGGCGGLLSRIALHHPTTTLYLADLPRMCILADYYLGTKLASMHGYDFQKNVIVMMPWVLPISQLNIDVVINTMSFQHMSEANMHYYGSALKQLGVRFIFSVNRAKGMRVGEVDSYVEILKDYGYRLETTVSLEPWRNIHFLHLLRA